MSNKILDFQTRFNQEGGFTIVDFARTITKQPIPDPSVHLADEPVVHAEVNAALLEGAHGIAGRWIAKCPFCAGAEYVDFRKPYFFCCSCWNVAVKGAWLKVVVPENRHEIEAVLMKRPAKHRMYKPGETLEQLKQENTDLGIKD